jgi:nitrogen fixation-related uncharacterized protein
MTSQTNSRCGLMFVLAITMAAIAVGGSVWAKGSGQQNTMMDGTRMDVSALMTSAEIANLPVLHVDQPF